MAKSQRTLCVSFSRTVSGLCMYQLFVWSNINSLHYSQWITFPTHSGLRGWQSLLFGIVSLFFLSLGVVVRTRRSVRMAKSQRTVCVSFSRTVSGLCMYQLFVWSNINSLQYYQWITFPTHSGLRGRQCILFGVFSFFFLSLCVVVRTRRSVRMAKSQRTLCGSFSGTVSGLCMYELFVWSNVNFLHYCQWITFPTQSCLVV